MKFLKKIILILVLLISIGNFTIVNSGGAPDDSNLTPLDNNTTTNNNTPDNSTLPALDAGGLSERMGNPTHSADGSQDLYNKLGADNSLEGMGILQQIVKFARESIFNLLWVIVVGVLLYIGFKLVIGRGTPDVFKKAMMGLVYLIIGIILIFSAWAMIKIILGVGI